MDIKKTVKKRLEQIQSLSAGVAPEFDEETIHKLRVATKKMRAVLRLHSFQTGKKIKLTGKFNKLYHSTGEIRDAQLALKTIGLPQFLERKLEAGKKNWKKAYSKSVTDNLAKKIRKTNWQPIKLKSLVPFYLDRISTLAVPTPAATDEELHTVRKKIKDLVYLDEILKKRWPKGYRKIKKLQTTAIEELAKIAGEHQDDRMAIQFITEYENTLMPAAEAKKIAVLKRQWLTTKGKDKNRLLSAIRAEMKVARKISIEANSHI